MAGCLIGPCPRHFLYLFIFVIAFVFLFFTFTPPVSSTSTTSFFYLGSGEQSNQLVLPPPSNYSSRWLLHRFEIRLVTEYILVHFMHFLNSFLGFLPITDEFGQIGANFKPFFHSNLVNFMQLLLNLGHFSANFQRIRASF